MKKELESYIKELDNQIEFYEKQAEESHGATTYATCSHVASALKIVKLRLRMILIRSMAQNKIGEQ